MRPAEGGLDRDQDPVRGANSCRYARDGECDEPDLCDRGTDTADCSGVRPDRDFANSCEYAYDGECDEPEYCDRGTDTADCSGVRPDRDFANSCEYAYDGECDEPEYCDRGTDTADCSGVRPDRDFANSCEYAYDGECDEPEYCDRGTDTFDCGTGGQVSGGGRQVSMICNTAYGACQMWQPGMVGSPCVCNYYGNMIPGLVQ